MRMKAAGPAILVAVAVLAATAYVVDRFVVDDGSPCGALLADVEDFGGYSWDNGFTSSGSEWISVMTDGVTEADRPSRERIAVAVEGDADGFDRFRSALPEDLEPAARRLHTLARDHDRPTDGAAVERDARSLARHAAVTCGTA